MLTANAISGFKDYVMKTIAYAKYKVGANYYTVPLQKVEIMPDGKVAVYVLIDHAVPGNITVNQLQLYNTSNVLWAEKAENITRLDMQEGILIRFTFAISET